MDVNPTVDVNCIRVKEKLNQYQIKLWLPPFLKPDQIRNDEELKKLADTLSEQLSMSSSICLLCLEHLQAKALSKLKERNNFQSTGLAALKVRVPNKQGGNMITINIELTKTGLILKEEISKVLSVPVERLKIIAKGKLLKDDIFLQNQGIKNGFHLMAVVLQENSDISSNYDFEFKQLSSTKADIELLSESKYFQVEDQSGKLLKLPQMEKKSLITAMTLHEKGRAALKKKDFAFALVLLLEAEKEFCNSNSSLLKCVDNYGVLSLDIVWCYLNLQSMTQLPDAEERLRQCEESFQQSYGNNLERLTAVKGFTGNETALFMRLHLLQAIVLYHQNRIQESNVLIQKAEQELKSLEVDDGQLCQLIELGYGESEARLALRASRGDINMAVTVIENKRAEKKKNKELEAEERKRLRHQKKLGKCLNGEWVDLQMHKSMMAMGFSYEQSKHALAQSNNNINDAINLIHVNVELSLGKSNFDKEGNLSNKSLDKISDTNSESESITFSVNNRENKTLKEVIERDDSDEDDDDDDGPSSSHLKKEQDEAYVRLMEDISNVEDDHLDLNLVLETEYLNKYKGYISNR